VFDFVRVIPAVMRKLAISALVLAAACGGPTQPGAGAQPNVQPPTATIGSASTTPPPGKPAVSPAPSISASASSKPATAAASPGVPPGASPGRWTFDADPVGGLPSGAKSFNGQWAVRAEADAPSPPNALCQTGNAEFPAIGLDNKPYTDLTLVTRFKPISGKQDEAGGLIFRVQDKDNYYILRANALEDNVIFFTYVGARRSELKGANGKVTPNTWHELRVEVRGTTFLGFLDGKQVVDASDGRYMNGGIGLWTKSDSVTCFDDVEVTGL
jgi:hypothetical protein